MNLPEAIINEFVDTCHDVVHRGLVKCSSGNMSMRVGKDTMLVTTTRTWIGRIRADQLALCNISDGSVIEGGRPTVEINFHSGILRERPDMDVVLHFQSPYATALACRDDLSSINFNVIPEIPVYMGTVGIVPFHHPGSQELADAVVDVMKTHDVALLRNHGLITLAKTVDYAVQNAEFFELASSIISLNGNIARPMPEDAVQEFLALSPYDTSTKV